MCNDCWQAENMYASYDDLEMLYPEIYKTVHPLVVRQCDLLESKYGPMYKPTNKELATICKNICEKIKNEFDNGNGSNEPYEDSSYVKSSLNTLFMILIITELIQRRRFRKKA